MRNLKPIVCDDQVTLLAIVPRKKPLPRRQRLEDAIRTLIERYAEYTVNASELSAISLSPLVGDLIQDCQSFYSSDSEELSALRKAIFDGQPAILRSVCQYCSLGEPNTLDHYAPKGRFPEFSMFSKNLIPCCGKCNMDKGEQWMEKGHRHFVNLYFDSFLNQPILKAELKFEHNGEMAIMFSFDKHSDLTDTQFAIIKSHFDELDLHDRHTQRAIGLIAEAVSNVRSLININMRLGQIEEMLGVEADSKAKLFGPNYWQAAVYRCLEVSGRFMEECLGDEWLPRACVEVEYLLGLPISAATDQMLRRIVETRAWRRYFYRGSVQGASWADWFDARLELGIPKERWV